MLVVAPSIMKKHSQSDHPMNASKLIKAAKTFQQREEHITSLLSMSELGRSSCGYCTGSHQPAPSANGHIPIPDHPDCPKNKSLKALWVNNVAPMTSALGNPFSFTNESCKGGIIQQDGSDVAGLIINDLCNNVAPFTRRIEKSIANMKKPCQESEHQKGHSRIPSIVIDDTYAPQTFVFAVMTGSTASSDPTIKFKIRNGCSTQAEVERFASKQAYDCIAEYASKLNDDTANEAFHILAVGEDYPDLDIYEPGDPYFPPTYNGLRPNENTWAVCKPSREVGFEVWVRYWKHSSHLRWIKTMKFPVQDEWRKVRRPPLKVYLAQCRSEFTSQADNVYPGRREPTLEILGAFWSLKKASRACEAHIASLDIEDVTHVEKASGGVNMVYEAEGRRHKWCVKPYDWDGGIPGLV